MFSIFPMYSTLNSNHSQGTKHDAVTSKLKIPIQGIGLVCLNMCWKVPKKAAAAAAAADDKIIYSSHTG